MRAHLARVVKPYQAKQSRTVSDEATTRTRDAGWVWVAGLPHVLAAWHTLLPFLGFQKGLGTIDACITVSTATIDR